MPWVYILRSGASNLFKIGRTEGDVEARIRQLATGNPHRLTKFDAIETEHDALCEGYLHKTLRSRRSVTSAAREFFEIAPEELANVLREAREFLNEFVAYQTNAQQFSEHETDGMLLKPGDEEWSIYRKLAAAREDEDVANFQRQLLENKLKVAIGTSDGLDGLATWRLQARDVLDQAALKAEQPEMHNRYLKTSRVRVFRSS
jgi:hypothetical protein